MQITCTNGFLVPKFLQILHSEVGQLSTSLSRFSRDQVICLRPILPIVIFIFTAHRPRNHSPSYIFHSKAGKGNILTRTRSGFGVPTKPVGSRSPLESKLYIRPDSFLC